MTAPGVPALIWPGGAALSGFRLEKLLRDCQARVPAVTGVAARFLHVVELGEPLTPRLVAASTAILGGVALVVLLGAKRRVS